MKYLWLLAILGSIANGLALYSLAVESLNLGIGPVFTRIVSAYRDFAHPIIAFAEQHAPFRNLLPENPLPKDVSVISLIIFTSVGRGFAIGQNQTPLRAFFTILSFAAAMMIVILYVPIVAISVTILYSSMCFYYMFTRFRGDSFKDPVDRNYFIAGLSLLGAVASAFLFFGIDAFSQ
ncbi:MAG: hypothetical protein AAGC95_07400 [Pseudomonadota bacterium]